MKRALLLFPLLMLAGCGELNNKSKEGSDSTEIYYRYNDLFAHYDLVMHVTPDNQLTISERRGMDAASVRRISSYITPEERSSLTAAFRDWKKLNHAYSTDLSPQIEVIYNDYQVNTSSMERVPETFRAVKSVLDRIATSIIRDADDRTRAAATQQSTAPAVPETAPAAAPVLTPAPGTQAVPPVLLPR